MSESENKESLTIARLSLYATLIAAVLAALTLFVDTPLFGQWIRGAKPPEEAASTSGNPNVSVVPPAIPAVSLPPEASHPLGEFAQLTDDTVRNRTFEAALNGLPYVTTAPTEGAWLGKICGGDVIVTVNDDSPPDDLSSVGAALAQASTIQLRPADLLESGPSANIAINPLSPRRC